MKEETSDNSLELLRHELGSIDLSDIQDEDMNESERKEYIAAISAVFPRIEKDIKKFLHTQLMFSSNNAENWEQVIFGRGAFNGMDLLLNHWKKANNEFLSGLQKDEEMDENNPMPEL